jgi:sugar-specific transcriptional regulator TrmB
MERDAIEPLIGLGLTALEAEIYVFLLQESPATGYRIAQAIGKPAANTYKAIESLARKGAVLLDEGRSRLCRAVPAAEFLGRLERGFRKVKREAAAVLEGLPGAAADDRVYQLRSRDQVFERCRNMLERCRQVALLDVYPQPLEELRADVERAVARGVAVALQVYAPAVLPGAEVVLKGEVERVVERWPGQWLNLGIDGQEHLLAYLTADGKDVHQAIWTGSAYLSWVYHTGASSELVVSELQTLLDAGASAEELRDALRRDRQRIQTPDLAGYQILQRRFGKEPRGAGPAGADRRTQGDHR